MLGPCQEQQAGKGPEAPLQLASGDQFGETCSGAQMPSFLSCGSVPPRRD